MSIAWSYCPSARMDLQNGQTHSCKNSTYAKTQSNPNPCNLPNCDFANVGGIWTCCICGGQNTIGWCIYKATAVKWFLNQATGAYESIETCDHICCVNCGRNESAQLQAEEEARQRKNKKKVTKSKDHGESSGSGHGGEASSSSKKHKSR
ncbi:hypothetical protein GQ53DRAFT_834027 [Thozetella sp. PMI_491]|nr:hypothetical protein GQ53DRAFT_834027 [Thozetella sp. PMI_491]